jgi:serine protease Do
MFPSRLRNLRFSLKSVFILMLGIAIGFALGTGKWSLNKSKRRVPPVVANAPEWDLLGLNLSEEPKGTFAQRNTRYRGGMHVNKVRPNSAAAREGVLPGDVLVGLHRWETASNKDIQYILSRPNFDQMGKLRFYVLRGQNTLYGQLDMAPAQ